MSAAGSVAGAGSGFGAGGVYVAVLARFVGGGGASCATFAPDVAWSAARELAGARAGSGIGC